MGKGVTAKGHEGTFRSGEKCSSILTVMVVIIKLRTLIQTHETGHLTWVNVNAGELCSIRLIFLKGTIIFIPFLKSTKVLKVSGNSQKVSTSNLL